jgi:hypothetical protein
MSHSQWHNFGIVVKHALKKPLSVVLISMGVLFALTMHDLLGLLILGGSVGCVVVYAISKLHDEQFIREAIQEDSGWRHTRDNMMRTFRVEELDVESRVRMKTIIKLQNEIAEDVTNSPVDEHTVGLADTLKQTEYLVGRALALAQQKRELHRYLQKTDESAIVSRIQHLETRLEAETDSARRSEIELALQAKRRELQDYRAIEDAGARIMDQLESIECAFSGLRARLVRIKSTDIGEWMSANEELKVELGGLNTSVDTLEQSINEALGI